MPRGTILHEGMLAALPNFFPATCTVQVNTPSAGDGGERTPSWANLASHVDIPCAIAPAGIREGRAAGAVESEATHTVLLAGSYTSILASGDAVPKHQVVSGGRSYQILGVEHDSQSYLTRLKTKLVTT